MPENSPKVGAKAPPFTLPGSDGRSHGLSDHSGSFVVVYFYPRADTPGCTKQACSVRDARPDLKKLKIAAVGISPDQPAAQQKFDAKYDLGFPLLADPDKKVAKAYGAFGKKTLYGKVSEGIIRSSFLIDGDGALVSAWYKVSPEETVPLALAALRR
jgi:peroxiredoxin Q/BCP